MEIIFSVIIPAYNVAGYLEHCLDSILAQTFQKYEVILIDDGSHDKTPEIADSYARKDSRIHVIHKKNQGVSIARNIGICQARGRYFLFFDGDDFVEPYCMEELYAIAQIEKADTILYGYHRYQEGAILETCYPIFPKAVYQDREILQELVPRLIGLSKESIKDWFNHKKNALYVENPALWRAMVSADIIRKNRIRFKEELKVGEDTIFISEYLSFAKNCYVLQKCFYYLVMRETSTIYQYEKNAIAKLDGKTKLLKARKELTESIEKRCRFSIAEFWKGTVIMSCIELSFLFSIKSKKHFFWKRYQMWKQYIYLEEVQLILNEYKFPIKMSIRVIPFFLLKVRGYFLLFLCTSLLQLLHYEFKRA